MPDQAENKNFREYRPIYGSLAYDLNRPEVYDEEYSAAPAEPEKRRETRTRAKPTVHTRQSVAPAAVAGVLLAAFLVVTGITAQVRLFAVSAEAQELQEDLDDLEEENARLRIAYESAFNLAEVEDYAVNTLGMRKPTADQIDYIDTTGADRAVVVDDGSGGGLVETVTDLLSGFAALYR